MFAEISIEESLRRADAADRHGQEELHQDRGCCGRYMIGGYQAGQISLDDLASGLRNRAWAAITRDRAAELGRLAVRRTTLSQ